MQMKIKSVIVKSVEKKRETYILINKKHQIYKRKDGSIIPVIDKR